jgi:hypothetical protein
MYDWVIIGTLLALQQNPPCLQVCTSLFCLFMEELPWQPSLIMEWSWLDMQGYTE